MRTEQIDAYRRSLRAVVTRVHRDGGPSDTWIVLDQSLLYPTSGGQLHDEGWIRPVQGGSAARVVDVRIGDGDEVRHRVDGTEEAVLDVGTEVEVVVDWERRFAHMQRHSAQHLVSQAFLHVDARFETASVSLTSADCTVDLMGNPDDDQVQAAIDVASGWAYQAMAIDSFEIDESDLAAWPLRRPPKVRGTIRLVRMGQVELSACGGTHVANTAEVLPLLALGRKRIRGDLTRVTFRAGMEASALARRYHRDLDDLARRFSARPDDVVERVSALQASLAATERHATALGERWARARVEAHVDAPTLTFFEDDPTVAAALVAAAAEVRPRGVVVVGAVHEGRATVVIQAGPRADVADVRPALQAALDLVEGRGGGKPDRARGSGPKVAALAEAVEAARRVLAPSPASAAERDGS